MNQPTETDNRSPWYETFTAAALRWLPGTEFRAQAEQEAEAAQAVGGGSEEQWATEALFEWYNE